MPPLALTLAAALPPHTHTPTHLACLCRWRCQEFICEPVTFCAAEVLRSLDECVDLLKALHDRVDPIDFKRPNDTHVFDVFETAQCVAAPPSVLLPQHACDCP